MLLNPFELHSPRTLTEALKLHRQLKDTKILAGGTFLINNLKALKKNGLKTPQHIISLRRVKELNGVSLKKNELIIASMTTIHELFESPFLENNLSVLKTVCRNIGTATIRNMATIGGNLASRYTWTEMGCVLLALDAKLHFRDAGKKEDVLSTENFLKNNAKTDKLLTRVTMSYEENSHSAYYRVGKTSGIDVPILAVCIQASFIKNHFAHTRVSINTGTAFSQRDQRLENFLNDSVAKEGILPEAMQHLTTEIYDTRSDDYKKHMFRVAIKNCILELMAGAKK